MAFFLYQLVSCQLFSWTIDGNVFLMLICHRWKMVVPSFSMTVTLHVMDLPMEIMKDALLQRFCRYVTLPNPMITNHLKRKELLLTLVQFHNPARVEETLREGNHVILGQEVSAHLAVHNICWSSLIVIVYSAVDSGDIDGNHKGEWSIMSQ